jgi:iron complex outermembrane recepter protein
MPSPSSRTFFFVPLLTAFLAPAQAQDGGSSDAESLNGTTSGNVVVIGTRRTNTTELSSPAPVDVYSSRQLAETGALNLNQALQELAPSFQYNVTAGSDGVATIRPAALRGLSPSQTLVLINGKRAHLSAFVNNKSGLGRGAQAFDLATIPLAAIDRVEVLRDGAAAQYGSDAIAGVINIVLRNQDGGGGASVQAGKYTEGDGFNKTGSAWKGFTLPGDGFLTLAGEAINTQRTMLREGADSRPFYFANDPRETSGAAQRVWTVGQPAIEEYNGVLNAEWGLGPDLRAYVFGNLGYRLGRSQGLFRRPNDNGTVRSIFPDGFLPLLNTTSKDAALNAGLRYGNEKTGLFDLDINYGGNRIAYDVPDSINASLGAASPRSFYAGGMQNTQASLTLDYVRNAAVDFSSEPLVVSAGAAYRHEKFSIDAGDPASWIAGSVPILDGPSAGSPAPAGAQGFPGYRPDDAGTLTRSVLGVYAGLENQLTEKFQWGATARAEHYSDFGNTWNGKLSLRYDFTPTVGLRATASNGYRAPSLGQSDLSSTQTTFRAGEPFDVRNFPVDHPAAQALGATALKPEKSINFSTGLVLQPWKGSSLTIDAYQIAIHDRITLSETLSGPLVERLLRNAGFPGVSGASFFVNALDTRTRGLDVVGNHRLELGNYGKLDLGLGYNYGVTRITGVRDNPSQLAGSGLVLVGRTTRGNIESYSPRSVLRLTGRYALGSWTVGVTESGYGRFTVVDTGNNPALDQIFGPQWVTDLSLAYKLSRNTSLSLGVNNLFDSYPDKTRPELRQSGGRYVYPSSQAPVGAFGTYYSLRLATTF